MGPLLFSEGDAGGGVGRARVITDDVEIGLAELPEAHAKLVVTSPPYNIGKVYEEATDLEAYLGWQRRVIEAITRVVRPDGAVCWQVGNYVDDGEVFPLDIYFYPIFKQLGYRLRNRVIWHFDHGLHASRRLSGRYETLLWFTRGEQYTFNLDPIRVPSKYPGKLHFKGKKRGLPSGNPLGKNPSDFWRVLGADWESAVWEVPNVKANHCEKTAHPCQFPIELVERCVLAMTDPGDVVLDPFAGVGSTLLAAVRHDRRAVGIERSAEYCRITQQRLDALASGELRIRPLGKPVHRPSGRERVAQVPLEWSNGEGTT